MDEIIELVNDSYHEKNGYHSYEGVLVKTNKQEIKLLISSDQSCCENSGYIVTNDSPADFIGAKVLEITRTDSGLTTVGLEDLLNDDQCSMIFCTVKTDRGDLQFTAYNSHNGYYGHEVLIKSNQLTVEDGV